MAAVQTFLNRRWKIESEGRTLVRPRSGTRCTRTGSVVGRRVRTSRGLGPHTDSGAVERLAPAGVPAGVPAHVPGRTSTKYDRRRGSAPRSTEYPGGTTMCSVFRSFQGWIAMSEMRQRPGRPPDRADPRGDGLHPGAPAAGRRARGRALRGQPPARSWGSARSWHPLLMRALSSIPNVQAG